MNTDVHSDFDYGKNLLAFFRDRGIKAVIAGGFVRDVQAGVPFRDIDLYISDKDWDEARGLLCDWDDPEPIHFDEGDPEYTHQYIQCHEELDHEEPGGVTLRVDLIAIKASMFAGAHSIIERFNLGFNQVAMVADGHIVATPARIKDLTNNTVTILRTDWGIEGTAKAIDKLLVKYPNLKLVYPNGNRVDLDVFRTEGLPAVDVEWAAQ